MQSTLTERATPYRPTQRALQFSLLFGASGGVARPGLAPERLERHRRFERDRAVAECLEAKRHRSHFSLAFYPTSERTITQNCGSEGEK